MRLRLLIGSVALAGALAGTSGVYAQAGARSASAGSPASAEKAAPFDLTGYWVAVVTEDWRWRMMTAPKGDYASVPLNAAGRRLADQFNPDLYGGSTDTGAVGGGGSIGAAVQRVPLGRYQVSASIDCRAYGAAGIMRMPMRVHISWSSPNELKLDTDWGQQTRVFHFVAGQPYADIAQTGEAREAAQGEARGGASMQGYSTAAWERSFGANQPAYQRGSLQRPGGAGAAVAAEPPGGDLAVLTSRLAPGWLRRNGVPYGSRTRLLEHYQAVADPTGARWFDVTSEVMDPEYLTAPFITSSDFQQEPDGSKWAPHPCKQVAQSP